MGYKEDFNSLKFKVYQETITTKEVNTLKSCIKKIHEGTNRNLKKQARGIEILIDIDSMRPLPESKSYKEFLQLWNKKNKKEI